MRVRNGFTLVEMAIVLVIIGLLLGGMMMPLSTQMDQRRVSETQKALDEINQALIGYAVTNKNFPCPAISATNGSEGARTNGVCDNRVGLLPWATLGVSQVDAWGYIFRYSVTPAFTDSGTPFTLATSGNIDIRNDNSATIIATAVPAVVMSVGKNGYYGTTTSGATMPDAPATNADERTNGAAAGTTFVSKIITANTAAPGGAFDDIVTWVTPGILFNRMVAAGQL